MNFLLISGAIAARKRQWKGVNLKCTPLEIILRNLSGISCHVFFNYQGLSWNPSENLFVSWPSTKINAMLRADSEFDSAIPQHDGKKANGATSRWDFAKSLILLQNFFGMLLTLLGWAPPFRASVDTHQLGGLFQLFSHRSRSTRGWCAKIILWILQKFSKVLRSFWI